MKTKTLDMIINMKTLGINLTLSDLDDLIDREVKSRVSIQLEHAAHALSLQKGGSNYNDAPSEEFLAALKYLIRYATDAATELDQ